MRNFLHAILTGTVVDLYPAFSSPPRCQPCVRIAPVFNTLSNKYPQVVFLEVDVHTCPVGVIQYVQQMFSFLENFAIGIKNSGVVCRYNSNSNPRHDATFSLVLLNPDCFSIKMSNHSSALFKTPDHTFLVFLCEDRDTVWHKHLWKLLQQSQIKSVSFFKGIINQVLLIWWRAVVPYEIWFVRLQLQPNIFGNFWLILVYFSV